MPSLVLLLLVSLLSILTQVQAQTQSKDFIITGNSAWVLTYEGKISVIDLASKKVSKTIKSDVAIVHLAQDRQGTIVVADNVNQLKTYNDATDSWQIRQTLTNTMVWYSTAGTEGMPLRTEEFRIWRQGISTSQNFHSSPIKQCTKTSGKD
jgi:hypothetical protein